MSTTTASPAVSVHAVDRGAGFAQRRDLGGSLPDPQRAQRGPGQRQPGRRQRVTELQNEQCPHPVGQADRRDVPEHARNQPERIGGLLPGDHLQAGRAGRGGLRRGQLEARHEQR